ncbi:hypothetical protein NP233_g12349 [Leucocoprinus birnbaumii]|uniref:F-box domain-containing protein n=1 Tax=Leucocoprinus birnbaumii TaxID=56174 RepID=A0AAD5VH66_9AGAR|nr:hypothetical protein NP233_g12349 [Leucocoprinus birnbaumii]
MTVIFDLPFHVFSTIISFLKDGPGLGPLRLVCRHFNDCISDAMFDTITIYGSTGKPAIEHLRSPTTPNGLRTAADDCSRLTHQLNTLRPHSTTSPYHPHIALRRAKRLKIFVSELLRLDSLGSSLVTRPGSDLQKEIRSTVQQLTLTLPAIIRSLENLRETT